MKIFIDSDTMTKHFSERKHSFAKYGTFAIFASMGLFGLAVATPKLLNGTYNLGDISLEMGGGGILISAIYML